MLQSSLITHETNFSRVATVLELLIDAVWVYGLPYRFRSDKGKEKFGFAWYMLNQPLRGPERNGTM